MEAFYLEFSSCVHMFPPPRPWNPCSGELEFIHAEPEHILNLSCRVSSVPTLATRSISAEWHMEPPYLRTGFSVAQVS